MLYLLKLRLKYVSGELCSVLDETASRSSVQLNPVNIRLVASGDRCELQIWHRVIELVRVLMVNVLNELGDLVVGRDKGQARSVQLSVHAAVLQVSTLEAALLQLGLGDERLSEELLGQQSSVVLVLHSQHTHGDASGRSVRGIGTSLPLIGVDVSRPVLRTELLFAARNDVDTRLVSATAERVRLGNGSLATLGP